jgi:hypothetical protein
MQVRQNILYCLLPFLCVWCLLLPTLGFSQEQPLSARATNSGSFGKTPCFVQNYLPIRLTNTSKTPISISSLNFANGDFRVDTLYTIFDSSRTYPYSRRLPITLASGDTLFFLAVFQPFRQGIQTTDLRVGFRRSGSMEEFLTWNNFVSGYGVPVGIYSAPKPNARDWVTPIGSSSVRSIVLRNLVGSTKYIRKIEIEQSGNDFAVSDILPRPDSVDYFAVIPIRFTPSQPLGISYTSSAVLKIIVAQGTTADTVEQKLWAFGRTISAEDVVIRPGLRPMRDSIPNGDSLTLEVFLAQADKQKLSRIATDSMRALIAVYKNNVLPPLRQWYDNKWQAIELPIQQSSPWRIFEVTGKGIFGGAWNGRDDVLMRMSGKAMISETDQTPLHLLDFQWLGQGEYSYIVQLPAQSTNFTVQTCTAGGKRLFKAHISATFALQSAFPNPADSHFEVAYTVTEKQNLSLSLYNAQGNLVRTIKSALHEAGEYSERLETGFLATGTYFLRLSGETTVQQRVVNVIK